VQIVGVIALVSTWGAGLLLRNSGWVGIRTRDRTQPVQEHPLLSKVAYIKEHWILLDCSRSFWTLPVCYHYGNG
jgi:hypothetical protein